MSREPGVIEAEDILLKRVGEKLRLVRKNNCLKTSELARMVNLSESFLGIIERGEKGTRLFNLVNICYVLGIKLNDLVYDTGAAEQMFREETKELNDLLNAKRNKIKILINNMNERQLDTVISLINTLYDTDFDSLDEK